MVNKSSDEGNLIEDLAKLQPLQRIGAGSFATVYISHGGACAYKVVHSAQNTDIIEKEYRLISALYLKCDSSSFFRLPRSYAYYDPATNTLIVDPPSSSGIGYVRRLRPSFTEESFSRIKIENACYVMDRVFVLPFRFSEPIRELYYPAAFKEIIPPTICRLYFGKVLDTPSSQEGRPIRFFNSTNFPIDRARYVQLAKILDLVDIDEVVAGMGDTLARLHWHGGIDGRDIEWVVGGDGFAGISYFVIDFNQCREWVKTMEGVSELVTAFMSNDPYYPRPRPDDPLYQTFRDSYLNVCPSDQDLRKIALAFVTGIEKEQAKRDAAPRNT